MKNVKMYKDIKKIFGGTKVALAGLAGAGTLLIAGCTVETIEDPTEVVVDVTEQPTEIEIIDTNVEPVEDVKEELPLPEFKLYDEDGNFYEPVEVTADDIYKRIDELEEKYGFESDWDRDSIVAYMLLQNGYYMSEEDLNIVYDDYLTNYGLTTAKVNFDKRIEMVAAGENKIPLAELYIDKKLAAEAEKIDNYYANDGDIKKLEEAYADAIKEEPYYYSALTSVYYTLMPDVENSMEYYDNSGELFDKIDVLFEDESRIFLNDEPGYVSSHDDKVIEK